MIMTQPLSKEGTKGRLIERDQDIVPKHLAKPSWLGLLHVRVGVPRRARSCNPHTRSKVEPPLNPLLKH